MPHDRVAPPVAGPLARIALYGSSRAAVELVIGARGVALAAVLGPQTFGIWTLFRLVLTYATFTGLGLARGLELEVAKARGPERTQEREAWGRTALGCTLLLFGTLSMAAGAGSLFAGTAWLRELLLAVAAGLLVERLWFYGVRYMRAAGSLRDFALLELSQAASQLVLVVGLALAFGLAGAFVGFVLATLLAILLLRGRAPMRPTLDRKRLRAMLAVGLPLSASQLLGAMLATVDRLVVGGWLGIAALGQYAFGVSIASLGLSAALVVQTVVFPGLYGRLEREGVASVTRDHLERTVRPYVLLLAPLAGAGSLALAAVASMALPRYAPAVPIAAVFVFAGIAQGSVSLASVAIVAARQQAVLPLVTLAALALSAGLAVTAVTFGLGMQALAAGTVLARMAYAAGAVALVARAGRLPIPHAVLATLWPIPWCAAATTLLVQWMPPVDLLSCARALGVYFILVAPVLVAVLSTMLRLRRRD